MLEFQALVKRFTTIVFLLDVVVTMYSLESSVAIDLIPSSFHLDLLLIFHPITIQCRSRLLSLVKIFVEGQNFVVQS